ncbi:MAG: beta-N-acetylhexosaminidase, partial [Muribaculaceae bacterium]|nr:beta-N-acetylhexosaminidase [Muribaculaceae bacterium]
KNSAITLLAAAAAMSACSHSGSSLQPAPVTPLPAEIEAKGGTPFILDNNTTYFIAENADSTTDTRINAAVKSIRPFMQRANSQTFNQIRLTISEGSDIPAEGYKLTVNRNGVTIDASTGEGLFYGLQTLSQLAATDTLAQVSISDAPRFPYRGLMIDVSRNFRDKDFIMKQIDAMAALKLNTLHLHMTDGAGWRLQIDRYPRLTEFAAWRSGDTWKEWNSNGNRYLPQDDPEAKGGYYTKDDIREIVQYAADRYITIIPEIEMPSHSEEVMAAYPELGCTKKPYTTSDFCPGQEATYTFIENVLDEVIELFPSRMIHIGGDEAPKTHWHDCPACQKRMKDEGLTDVDELQSYMVHRIERYLNSKGRDMIGWDEIMQGGLSPTATVLSWRGMEEGIKAAKLGNSVVMAPGKYCYLDGYQDAPGTQPEAIGGYLPLELVYSYNPAPDSLDADVRKNIRGLEGTMFTEYIPTDSHAEYMLYPRTIALAEVAWTPQERRSYADFRPRAEIFADTLRARGYNTFRLADEAGNRPEAADTLRHLAFGAPVTYNVDWWERYPAANAATLTDGLRGGWSYNDKRWQGFLSHDHGEFDVTIDLGSEQQITYVGADFMQICGPDVWFPTDITISASATADSPFTELARIANEEHRDDVVSFKTFSWSGDTIARYVRYRATNPHGIIFTDEVVVK